MDIEIGNKAGFLFGLSKRENLSNIKSQNLNKYKRDFDYLEMPSSKNNKGSKHIPSDIVITEHENDKDSSGGWTLEVEHTGLCRKRLRRALVLFVQGIMESRYYEEIRKLKWPNNIPVCPYCGSLHVIEVKPKPMTFLSNLDMCKRRSVCKENCEKCKVDCVKYLCVTCTKEFNDLTNTIFSGHKLQVRTWIYCMLYKKQHYPKIKIAELLEIRESDVEEIFEKLDSGIIKRKQLINHFNDFPISRGLRLNVNSN